MHFNLYKSSKENEMVNFTLWLWEHDDDFSDFLNFSNVSKPELKNQENLCAITAIKKVKVSYSFRRKCSWFSNSNIAIKHSNINIKSKKEWNKLTEYMVAELILSYFGFA